VHYQNGIPDTINLLIVVLVRKENKEKCAIAAIIKINILSDFGWTTEKECYVEKDRREPKQYQAYKNE